MSLDARQIAQDIEAKVKSAGTVSPQAFGAQAFGMPGGGDFCSIWPQAKPVLELVAGVVIFIPGAGTTAGAVLQGLIKVGDQISKQVCKQ